MTAKLLIILSASLAAAGGAFPVQDDACQQINQPCPVKNAELGSNPPWFPSLMAYEHYDSGRTKLFQQAHFAGSYDDENQVTVRTAPTTYPSVYNMVYLGPNRVFVYGGGYGNIPNATGAFVAKVDTDTLKPIWYTQLVNTADTGEWDYPGVTGILKNGFIYVIYGYRLAKLDPRDGTVVMKAELPTGGALPENTSYNGFDALPDGTLIAKTIFREEGCELQGPPALLHCPDPTNVPSSILVSIDPQTLEVLDQVTLPTPVGGRPTTARFRGRDYVYFATQTTAIRYLIQSGKFIFDEAWNPGAIYQSGQTIGSAFAVMNDWVLVQTNGLPAKTALSLIAINQDDATRQFSVQPFAGDSVPNGFPTSWAPMSMSVDPDHNLIYTADSSPGKLVALELTANGLQTLWTVQQRTTEFLAVIGPRDRRVLVTTAIPPGQVPLQNTTNFVVWRDAQTGRELAHTEEQLPAITNGTMVQPYYFGKIFYPGLHGELIELTVRPRVPGKE